MANGIPKSILAHLILISRLKQVLSVKDTGILLRANKRTSADQDVYTEFCTMVRHVTEALTASLSSAQCDIAHLAMQLAVESYLSKVACEYLIDLLPEKRPKSRIKSKKLRPNKPEFSHSITTVLV